MADAKTSALPGEGDRRLVMKVRHRRPCSCCPQDATKRHTYLLPDARRNPASSAYGWDDCTYCSDDERYTCDDCAKPEVAGMEWCSTFSAGQRTASQFLCWEEEEAGEILAALKVAEIQLRMMDSSGMSCGAELEQVRAAIAKAEVAQ